MKAEWTNADSLTESQTTKAILVLNGMPNSCAVCPYRINKEHWRCLLITDLKGHPKYIYWSHEDITRARYSGCPLKPLPSKKPVSYHDDLFGEVEKNFRNIGWNDCLEEILGETE